MAGRAMKDMTNGSPMKLILGFLVPMLFGLLFQQFYSMVDTVIVGQYLGVDPRGGSRLHDLPEFYGDRVLHRRMQRICHTGGADVRGQRRGQAAPVCDQQRLALPAVFRRHDPCGGGGVQARASAYEYAGGNI